MATRNEPVNWPTAMDTAWKNHPDRNSGLWPGTGSRRELYPPAVELGDELRCRTRHDHALLQLSAVRHTDKQQYRRNKTQQDSCRRVTSRCLKNTRISVQ